MTRLACECRPRPFAFSLAVTLGYPGTLRGVGQSDQSSSVCANLHSGLIPTIESLS